MRRHFSFTALCAGLLVACIAIDLGAITALGEASGGGNATCCTPAIVAPAVPGRSGGDSGCEAEGDVCDTESCLGTRTGAVQGGSCETAATEYQCSDGFTRTYTVEVVSLVCGSIDEGCPCESTPMGTTEVTVDDDCTGDLCPE